MDPSYDPIIFIHVGKTGCQIGNSLWELVRTEHRIRPDGMFEMKGGTQEGFQGPLAAFNAKIDTFFAESRHGRYRPRAIFADLEPSEIQGIREGPTSKSLYHTNQFLTCREDAAANYARGYYSMGGEMIGVLMERVRWIVETCGVIQGFILTRSLGGGTGSGFGSLVVRKLRETYPKSIIMTLDLLPSEDLPAAATEPYNVLLANHISTEATDMTFLFQTDALLRMCERATEGMPEKPHFTHSNQLTAQIVTTLTSPLHLGGSSNGSLKELRTNVVPYDRLHFPLLSYAPVLARRDICPYQEVMRLRSILRETLDPRHQVVESEPLKDNFLAYSVIFRGDVSLGDMNKVEKLIKGAASVHKDFQLVQWAPQRYTAGFSGFPPVSVGGRRGLVSTTNLAAVGIINTPAIARGLEGFLVKARSMQAKKSYLHWYEQEGLAESELQDATEDLKGLLEEYRELSPKGAIKGLSRSVSSKRTLCSKSFPLSFLRSLQN